MHRFRILTTLMATLLLLVALVPNAAAAPDDWNLNPTDLQKASVTIDGEKLDADAFIVNGRTVVPLRAIFERLGAVIEWNPDTWTVTAKRGSTVVILTVGKVDATVDGKPVTLAVPPVLINSRTFVPLRFVSEALGGEVGWDQPNWTAVIKTGGGCTLAPFQRHEGTIAAGGETWGRCGSPHIVAGTFYVEGKDSPILTVEAGAVVRFEADASIEVGRSAPGGLVVNGKDGDPVYFTADTSGPQAGFWQGIRFLNQSLINDSRITNAVVEYAGQPEWGAITIEGYGKMVEVQLTNVEIKNSQYAGLNLKYQGRLKAGSAGLKISGTEGTGDTGGFPIMTAVFGSHNLPVGEFKNNAVNAVNIYEDGASFATIATNTTWKNVSIPYAVSQTTYVEGKAAPTLTIEPGVVTLWAPETALFVGKDGSGHLIADATRPEGGGEWRTVLERGATLANASSLEPGCALCGTNQAIVFGAWNASPERGAWEGVRLMGNAGDKTKLNGVVIAYGGRNDDFSAGLYVESQDGKAVKFQLSNSMITGAARSGMEFYGNVQMRPESTGNLFINNGSPMRMPPDSLGYLPAGQTISATNEDLTYILVGSLNSSSDTVTKSATWRNHGVPYKFEGSVYIGGSASPVITIEPGTELLFQQNANLVVGSEGLGSLIAVGKAGQPIKFTSQVKRAGAWEGIRFTGDAGDGNQMEHVVIEYANFALNLDVDLGGFIKNSTIRSSKEMGIYRGYGTEGTSFLSGLGIQFEGNAVDENEE